MRKLFLIAVVATSLLMLDTEGTWAFGHRRGGGGGCGGCESGCGGGRRHGGFRHRRHGGGGCGGCAASCGGCGAAATCAACGTGGACGAVCAMVTQGVIDGLADNAIDDASAIIVVDLPADATLRVDDTLTTSTSPSRVFVTPPLEEGRSYQYTLTAQVTQDGVLHTVTRQVTVRAGEETQINLELPVAAVVSR